MRGTYTGDLVDGIRHGNGKLVFTNGDTYEGAFRNGFREGYGVFTSEQGNCVYEGEWKQSVKHGVGKEKWLRSGDRYEGEYRNDAFHGKGILVRGNGSSKYHGEFVNGKKHGSGRMEFRHHLPHRRASNVAKAGINDIKNVLVMANAGQHRRSSVGGSNNNGDESAVSVSVYDGSWQNGRMHGEGKYVRADGSFYEGTWVDGLCHGHGKEMSMLTGEIYEGLWKKGMRHGDGQIIRNGKRRKGVWEMGQRIKWTSAEVPIVTNVPTKK